MAGRETATAQIFIGADNRTRHLDLKGIMDFFQTYHKGFNVQQSTGVWQGSWESCAVITVTDDKQWILETVNLALERFDQDSIAVIWLPEMQFYTRQD